MNTEQFAKVQEFFDTMPKVRHVVKVTNPNTGNDNEIVLEGMQSFLDQPFHMIVWKRTTELILVWHSTITTV